MKTVLVAGLGALTLIAGNAFAEGCRYGSQASVASVDEAAASSPVAEEDARLLALLREHENSESEAPVAQN